MPYGIQAPRHRWTGRAKDMEAPQRTAKPVSTTAVLSIAIFVFYCATDVLFVKNREAYELRFPSTILVWMLLVAAGFVYSACRHRGRWGLAILTTTVSFVVALVLIMTIGLWFHVQIGGGF